MIETKDRSGWFGASDTAIIMGNWKTNSFQKWWIQKLGLNTSYFSTRAMNAGTYYEHAILESIGAPRKDHQIIISELMLRVNFDGDAIGRIYEVKTHKAEKPFRVTKGYWQQMQVEMFAKLQEEKIIPQSRIVSYALLEADYRNFFNPIDPARLKEHPIEYDPDFIEEYLPRLKYLRDCLKEGVFPNENAD